MGRAQRSRSETGGGQASQPGAQDAGRSRPSAQGSNATRVARLDLSGPQPESGGDLDAVFDFVLAGDFDAAKDAAHDAAQASRAAGQNDAAQDAGVVWQVADGFAQATLAMREKRYDAAKGHAARAAARSRGLLSLGTLDSDDLNEAIRSAGQVWTLAQQSADKAAQEKKGRDVPMVDQHQLPHERNWAFCGVATLIMMLRANGLRQGSARTDLNSLASRVYHTGVGTSGADMAGVLRERGLKDSTYTTTGGTAKLLDSLDKGQPVPFGVTSVEGVVTKLEGGSSHRYTDRRVGDTHHRKFGGSGHWVLVVRYEGAPDKPTAFYVNDPDLGGELRCTPAQLDRMGEGSGNYWMVHQ